ncbi:response regulator transcription factor [Fuscibacter oryzae]|uniref:Response regulator n=1 Tax=Fuscibacter oryzae TaxID=2803939 RepID=A0A8J7MN41_9RHOB|nr:response regulator [Fuscibacter oryzae]MBL4927267.1 response regulator [Fuscibacter oryzae]
MAGQVLLIEDEANIAEAIRFLLTRDGCQVEVIGDGLTALQRLRGDLPDLVILDLMLPGASGLDILASLRADPRGQGLPVLMLTAKGQERDRDAAERAGVSAFMAKPFANADMRAKVRQLMGQG